MENSEKETITVFCKTCNAQAETKLIGSHTQLKPVEPFGDPVDTPCYVTVFNFAICNSCESPFLQQEDYYEIPGECSVPQGEQMLYPEKQESFDRTVPDVVRNPYQNAEKAYIAGLYEPCVIMCRKCLEAICYELGETKGTLQKRLEKLRENANIDNMLYQWANGLRMIGNDAAHELDARIEPSDALDSLDFVKAIIAYAFTLRSKYDAFQDRRKKGKEKNQKNIQK